MLGLRTKCKVGLLKSLSFLLFYSGVLALLRTVSNWFQLRRQKAGGKGGPSLLLRKVRNVQILTYHRVNDEKDFFFPAAPTQVFAKQMEYLATTCHLLSLEEAVERMACKDVPENAVVVTFDDGYRDNYLHAFPILQGLAIPATIFLTTAAISSRRALWHDRVFSAFRETRQLCLQGYESATAVYPLATLEQKLFAQGRVLDFLRTLTEDEREHRIDCLVEQLAVEEQKDFPDLMLSWPEVETMREHGIAFGSHTITHSVLSTLSPERMREEICVSKKVIENRLGITINAFAYPNGREADFNQAVKDIVREAGYRCAVTTIFGTNSQDRDVFELRRGGPWETHLPTFAVKLAWYKLSSSA